jgi:hypothetical protein
VSAAWYQDVLKRKDDEGFPAAFSVCALIFTGFKTKLAAHPIPRRNMTC